MTAAVLLPPVVLILWFGSYPAIALAFLVYAIVSFEYFSFALPFQQPKVLQLTIINCIIPAAYLAYGFVGLAAGVLISVVLNLLCSIVTIESEVHVGSFELFVPASVLGVCYPGVLASFLVVAVTELPGSLTLWTLLVVAAADTFAYFGGRAIGGVKLAPRLSPNKTVSGLCVGLGAAALFGCLAGLLLPTHASWPLLALSGFVVGCFSVFGDLTESMVKRIYNVKDSGTLLPGHGGLLDRVDALLFAIPALFLVSRVLVIV